MLRRRKYSKIDKWEVSRLVDACNRASDSLEIIYIPEYQRRLVWDRDKQKDLINSIKLGYPFGSLLLYEDKEVDGKRKYDLIDGLQRTNAIREYMKNPNKFFFAEDVDSEVANFVVEELQLIGEDKIERVRKALSGWVRSRRGFAETDGWSVDELAKCLIVDVVFIREESEEYKEAFSDIFMNEILTRKLKQFLTDVRTEADIKNAEVPIIVYSGDMGNLPEIFTLLNSTGVALSPYEVYAASWLKYKLRIREDAIKDAVKRKYEALVDGGFTSAALEIEDGDESDQGRDYSLFEYLFGFGHFLSNSFPFLFNSVDVDTPSSIGFNLVTACIGTRLSEMRYLDKRLYERNIDLNDLGEQIYESVELVNESLKPILSVNQMGIKSKPAIFHAELHIISLITSVFQTKYDLETLEERRNWKKPLSDMLLNLRLFYLYDIIRDHWRGSGDTKLHDDVSNQRFSRRLPSAIHWQSMLSIWFEEKQITLLHKRRLVRKASPEILFLKYIYVKKFSVYENAKAYHVEHIIPVNRLEKQVKETGESWPINCVANLALHEQHKNQRKGRNTFVEFWNHQIETGEIIQSEHEQNLKNDEDSLICRREYLPNNISNLSKEEYENFLRKRFDGLVSAFLSHWCDIIPNS